MLLYWLMYLLPATNVVNAVDLRRSESQLVWNLVIVFFAVLIGFREQVGGDWFTYVHHYTSVSNMGFTEALNFGDPGYYAVNWLIAQVNGSVYWVNFISACFVMIGVSIFSKKQPLPWLSLAVAVPYLLIVVSMGYTRQSAALGFVFIGLAALGEQNVRKFVIWVLIGALFHKSAILLLPIAALSTAQNKIWTFIWVGVTGGVATNILLLESADNLWVNYVEADYSSQGGLIRVLMNAVPSVLLLIFRNQLYMNDKEKKLWIWMSVCSLASIFLVLQSSTAVDRVALYFIPIQMYVFARLPFLAANIQQCKGIMLSIVVYYSLVLFVWLNFAAHSFAWLPYQNHFTTDSKELHGEPELFQFDPSKFPSELLKPRR